MNKSLKKCSPSPEVALMIVQRQSNGTFVASSPVFPELLTQGGDLDEIVDNFRDALHTVLQYYRSSHKPLPAGLKARQ